MKKYKTGSLSYLSIQTITDVEVERETETSVWINGRREAKHSTYNAYHNSWEEAHDFLMEAARTKVRNAESEWQRAKSALQAINNMRKPS